MGRIRLDSVTRKMLLPLVLASIAMLLGVLAILLSVREHTVEAAGIATAKAVASQIVNLRQFYTAEIATRAIQAGMQLDSEFEHRPGTLPLPATLVKALGKSIEREYPGMSIRLYSNYPFPNRVASERYDAFETRALTVLMAAPEQPQALLERRDGRRLLRLVVADRMQAGCVACHNARSDSPKRDWQVGDVRGAIEVTVPVDRIEGEIDRGILKVGLAVLAGILALAGVATFATRRAAGALQQLNRDLEDRVEARMADLSQANADLHQALHHIERSEPLAALGALIAGMAHELNTPMGNATLVLSTLTEQVAELNSALAANQLRKTQLEGFASAASQACALLERNLQRASALVADFKQVSADQVSQRRREFNLAELVDETLHTLAPSHKHSPVSINTSIPTEIRLDSYPGPLEQVISNLINNAVLHGMHDDQPLTISISACLVDTQSLQLTLSDNGRGMSPEVAAQAFQPFFTTRQGTGGTGLGLHLVHQLVYEVLGGSLTLDSQPGGGTRFDIRLPLQAPAAKA
ncbi:MAG: ATP-binding protein [Pseudomonas sp.]|uniref:ATP-binding protein n=1 Tax=Pseudomonas sp. TaxID=306 RepID=UPI0027341F09|nr:ATP-binding protein [Pseudomonas sp.]MDP3848664.1 ATP-binding protein [Pseudomonas sp.]